MNHRDSLTNPGRFGVSGQIGGIPNASSVITPPLVVQARNRIRSLPVRYGAAVLAVAAAFLLRRALTPVIGPTELGFSILLPAVLFAGWFGGLGPGVVSVVVSAIASDYFLFDPVGSLIIRNQADALKLLVFTVLGFAIVYLGDSQRRAVERAVRAEGAERIERRRFETTLSSIGDAVMSSDTAGRITYLNPVAERLTGWTSQEASGRPLEEVFRIINEETRIAVDNPVVEVLRDGQTVALANHTLLISRDRAELPIDDSASPIRDARGHLVGVVLVFRDVTGKRAAETQLRLRAEELRTLIDATPALVWLAHDPQCRRVTGNDAANRLLGVPPETNVSQTPGEGPAAEVRHFTPQGQEMLPHELPIQRAIASRQTIANAEFEVRLSGGRRVHLMGNAAPLFDVFGKPRGCVSVFLDITERKRTEEALEESEHRLATILKHLPVGVGLLDPAGRVVSSNPAWKRYVRRGIPSLDDAENARWRWDLTAVPPVTRNDYPGIRALRGEEVLPGIDFLWKDDDGTERWTRVSAVPSRDPSGQVTGALVLIQDVDQERRAEQQRLELLAKERALASERALRETEAELARVVRALSVGELATSIAHEVNQPLAGVVTNTEACLRWLGGNPPNLQEVKESLALIARDANRAGAVIRRIREFLRKETAETASLNINDVVLDAIELTHSELAKRRIEVRTELSEDIPEVHGDRIQLQQVILNLIMNAAEAMAAEQASRDIVVASRESRDGVLVSVTDSGVGISPPDLPRMFDALFTTKPSGMGMGLSISRSIIESHGGRIWAETNDGPGITVQFTLPAASSGQKTHVASDRS
jgi:PAS domain S-box-containing protein